MNNKAQNSALSLPWVPSFQCMYGTIGREGNCSAGGGGDTEAHFPNPPPSLAAVTGGGVQGGGARPAVRGGGGVNPTSMAQNDTHVALIILTTQMWGGGGNYWWKKLFRAKILCSCAFRANIRSYTKQRARHGTPFPHPPPSCGGRPCQPPPPPPPQSNFQVALYQPSKFCEGWEQCLNIGRYDHTCQGF